METEVFLYVVANASHVNLSNLRILVLCDEDFVGPLQIAAAANERTSFMKNIIPLAQPEMKNDFEYTLDDHPTAQWHRIVADRIIKVLNIKKENFN
jgi:hypothetical protein